MKLQYLIYMSLAIIKCHQKKISIDDINDSFRLPRTVIPERYFLNMTFSEEHEDIFKHRSNVTITVRCNKPTNNITLHSRNLHINSIRLQNIEVEYAKGINNYSFKKNYDFLHIHLNDYLEENATYKLKISFNGYMSRTMEGFYSSSYMDENGHKRSIVTTKFEPTNARAAFPCFDEPTMKAKFLINIVHDPQYTALSNMPVKFTKFTQNGKVEDTFEETLKMSTYLVAYIIHNFKNKTTTKLNHYGETLIHVWAPRTSLKKVTYATKLAPKLLSFFEEYFDIPYPLAKLDLIAVPDLPSGAIGNWGLITFRATNKHTIASTMAHEIAHYWFGDLVTIKWWSHLWLKEGIASYLARIAIGHLYPKKKNAFNKVLIDNMEEALATSRPVSIPINTPETVYKIYDNITYSKGSCVIRMMGLFLGSDVMKKGLKHYLNLHNYSSTEPKDLWNSLTIAAHEDETLSKSLTVNEIMDTWTTQSGYPLIDVIRNYTSGTVTVTQKRFLDIETKLSDDDSCYWVPLTYTTKAESDFSTTTPKKWLPCPKRRITFHLNDSQSWILFNVQASGLYRVNYDRTNWKMLIKELETNHKAIETLNRVLLIDDIMELAMTDKIDFKIAFDLIKYIRHDHETRTWCKVLDKLLKINHLLDHTKHHGLIKTYISNLLEPVYEKVDHLSTVKHFSELNLRIINTMCAIGNERCKKESLEIFRYWWKNIGNYTIPVPIRSLVFCQGVKNGYRGEYEDVWRHYLHSNVAAEKDRTIRALACTEERSLLEDTLNGTIEADSSIRPQDAFTVFSSVINSKKGSKIARKFFYNNIMRIYSMQSKGRDMKKYIREVVYSLTSQKDCDEMKQRLMDFEGIYKMTKRPLAEKNDYLKFWNDRLYKKLVDVLKDKQKP